MLLATTSCDFLDKEPENSVPENSVDFTNLDNMYMPVSGVYAKLRTGGMHWVIWPLSIIRDDDVWSGRVDDQATLVDMGNYTLPGIRVSVTADRPFTTFKANAFTPELSDAEGWDVEVYPLTSTYTLGVQIDF